MPHVVIAGGLDPSGAAGVVRDWLTCRSLGASSEIVVTAWTEQDTRGVRSVEPRPSDAVARNLMAACERARASGAPFAVKIGMVADPAIALALADALERASAATGRTFPVVFDPVLAASHGGSLFASAAGTDDPARSLAPLMARATVVTPNAAELARLAGAPVHDAESAIGAASRLVRQGVHAVLAKGGHVAGPAATDWLVDASGAHAISGARVDGDPRGTGCALASAIAVRLAEGDELVAACASAKAWLRDRIAAAIDVRGERHLP